MTTVIEINTAANPSFVTIPEGAGLPDQSGHADQFLKTDGSTLSWADAGGGEASSVVAEGEHGTLTIAANIQGAANTANEFLNYQPEDEDSPPWTQYVVQHDNEFGTRKNQVMTFGWNVQPSGRVDETKAAFATTLESHYEPNSFTHQSEWYLVATQVDGTTCRPIAVDAPEDSPPQVRIAGDSLILQDPETTATRWRWGLDADAGGSCIVVPSADLSTVFQIQRNNIPFLSQYNASGNLTQILKFDSDNELVVTPTVRAVGGLKSDGTVYFRDVTGTSVYAQTGFSGGTWSISSAIANLQIEQGDSKLLASAAAGTQLIYGNNKFFIGSSIASVTVPSATGSLRVIFGATTEWQIGDGAGGRALYPPNTARDIGTSAKPIATLYANSIQNADASNQTTTVGAAGAASALPEAPLGYLTVKLADGSSVKIPYYNT